MNLLLLLAASAGIAGAGSAAVLLGGPVAGWWASPPAQLPSQRGTASRARRFRLPSRAAVILSLAAGIAAAALMWLVLGLLLPSLMVGAMAGAGGLSLDAVRCLHRRGREREALVALVDLLVQLLAAGQSVRQALEALSKSGPTQLRPELQTIVERQRQVSLEQALGEAQLRIRQPLFTLTATALAVGSRSGGRLTPLLDELSRSAHQLEAVQRQLRAEQAQGRLGAMVIAAMPICLLVVLRVVNPEYLAPYASISGQLLLSLLLGLIVAGYLWMLWILRLPESELKVLQAFAKTGKLDDRVEGSA